MFYRLTDMFALRAWKYANRALYNRYAAAPLRLDKATFEVLLACDGEHDLSDDAQLARLVEAGVIEPCSMGEKPSEWSRFRRFEHRFVPNMNLMLTGKCNYNCRHCFNAAENADRMAEWRYEDALDLLDQAADCGFHGITLTGGEPMLHPRFLDIVREIYQRGMVLEKLTTNGYFITEEVLDEFARLRCQPQIKISFDGVGHHDWMRGARGIEARTLEAFALCHDKGFRTFAQVQAFRGNLEALPETLRVLEGIGVDCARIIRTIPLERWQKNNPGGSLSAPEYFDEMLRLAERYLHGDHHMEVVMWMFLVLYPAYGAYSMVPVKDRDGACPPTRAVCPGNRVMMAVTCEGNVVPCLQMGGHAAELGHPLESLRDRSLKEIVTSGVWHDEVCTNIHMLRKANAECDACPWFGHCAGGCRALAMLSGIERGELPNYFATDPMACLFFKGGWHDRVLERLADFRQV